MPNASCGPLVVELGHESIEARLLLQAVHAGACGLLTQRSDF
jgi:hypothetical protein